MKLELKSFDRLPNKPEVGNSSVCYFLYICYMITSSTVYNFFVKIACTGFITNTCWRNYISIPFQKARASCGMLLRLPKLWKQTVPFIRTMTSSSSGFESDPVRSPGRQRLLSQVIRRENWCLARMFLSRQAFTGIDLKRIRWSFVFLTVVAELLVLLKISTKLIIFYFQNIEQTTFINEAIHIRS